MVPIYIGIAVLVALIFIGFGISNAVASHQRDQAIAFDLSTPSPGPTPTIKPIQLKDGQPVGVASGFATPNPKKGQLTNTKTGGQGLPVDGIPCETSEQVAMHVHTHLTVIVRGKVVQVPEYIGFAPSAGTICLYWLHTHDASGIIHIEAADASAPSGGPYTLGMFFDIWGQHSAQTKWGRSKVRSPHMSTACRTPANWATFRCARINSSRWRSARRLFLRPITFCRRVIS